MIKESEGASDRIKALRLKRKQAYASLFDGFAREQEQLEAMYAPLREMLGAELGTLGKLTFSVKRLVDVEAWAKRERRSWTFVQESSVATASC